MFCHYLILKPSLPANVVIPRSVWHQTVRRFHGSTAHFITYHVFCFPKGSLGGRYLFVAATFTGSAMIHVYVDMVSGLTWSQTGAMSSFCIQVFGIMIEDGVKAIYHSWNGEKQEKDDTARSRLRFVGYLWVLLWLSWTMPAWIYPIMQQNLGQEKYRPLPFHILRSVLRAIKPTAHGDTSSLIRQNCIQS